MNQDDDTQNFILALIAAVVMGVIALVIGMAMYTSNAKRAKAAAPAPVAAAAVAVSAASAVNLSDQARVTVEGGVVKFYFASGKTDIAPNAAQALVDVIKGVQGGKKAVVSGFSDAAGDPAKNAELAKLRAFAVRDSLAAVGVAADKIELRKPQAITANASGSSSDARRVDVTLE